MEIIKERTPVEEVRRTIEFEWPKDRGAGYSFDADELWNPIFRCELGKENYEACMSGKYKIDGPFRRTTKVTRMEPAQGKCSCGTIVELIDQYHGACQCHGCGQWYNIFGQKLVSPEYWQEDEDYY